MKKYWNHFIFGIGIGMIIYILFLLVFKTPVQTVQQIIITVVLSGFIGLASLFYEIERWSFLQKSLSHLTVVFLIVFAMNYFNHWVDFGANLGVYLGFIIQFFIIYFAISFIMFLISKKQVQEINDKLKKKKG
ncbi:MULTISPECIES: DUF3021 domain-containing protein [Streptococcus]|uniref:DUF3021 domain-containing protein n=1 Tax=Streptococcus zalophi TaxID=640031 RepID=A0A934PAA0_9STRE|nr:MULTISPECIES: DUF3021 domain-containing protein [Streptococcus]MBJ8349960.1 DUF3021 domain-containing protein [Streptococcus zalophi]MCR8966955.1 DUF3021 domain-containing protein [Streptococcus zalophi]MCU9533121.1 DUF3021 domain-containing protein [Streptococcus sp. CSL10205-OR2]